MTSAEPQQPAGVWFLKGHGTENDFVLIPDRDGSLTITDAQVRAICDRRAGLGADGIIRVAPDGSGRPDAYFMDYRNADGSLAQMCGNGARVFAAFLYQAGWVPSGPFSFRTRGGIRSADLTADGLISIEMGPASVLESAQTTVRLADGTWVQLDGRHVDVGNPHLVVLTDLPVAGFDLTVPPVFDGAQFPAGVNVEFVNIESDRQARIRVFERGVGETRSCGTGTVAVAAALLDRFDAAGGVVRVQVPGGVVNVEVGANGSTLTGPAVLVGSGRIDSDWWAAHA